MNEHMAKSQGCFAASYSTSFSDINIENFIVTCRLILYGQIKVPSFFQEHTKLYLMEHINITGTKELREVRTSWLSKTLVESEPWRNEVETLRQHHVLSMQLRSGTCGAQPEEGAPVECSCLMGTVGPARAGGGHILLDMHSLTLWPMPVDHTVS